MNDPIFVGGTGRSGTTIVARVLAADPTAVMIPVESRLLVDEHGLTDLVAGSTSFRRFERAVRGRWWLRERQDGTTRGVHSFIELDVLDRALDDLRGRMATDPVAAGNDFVRRMFDPVAEAEGAEQWIEMTPPNVARGADLVAIMGDCTRIIHSMRDGRDVAASVAGMSWGPDEPFAALEWWAERMAQAHSGCSALADSNLLVVQLEDLVVRDREGAVDALAEFCALDAVHLQNYLDRMVRADRAHIGRWTDAVETTHRPRFDDRYDELRDQLVSQGCPVPV